MKTSVKKTLLLITVLSAVFCLIAGCAPTLKDLVVDIAKNSGDIGAFSLLSPAAGERVMYLPEFTWQTASNADSYQFELCSTTDFEQADGVIYVRKTGLTEPRFTLRSAIKEKNSEYFWRVTAINENSSKTTDTGTFYYAADEKEILFDVNYADEWTVHEQGSAATISVDDSDFFGNGKNSLVVSFVEEDVKRGIPSSDGWIVVTHSQETEMYGVDAFYFNFYYSGNDADVYLRVVDEDNEYYHAQIKLANNAKQTVIVKFTDFELRTKGGTTIANQVFDYNYIKYVELVFEKSFGDGVAMISDLRAVKFDNYTNLFIDRLDFSAFDESAVIHDNYNFGVDVSDDGKSLTYAFSGVANEDNDSGINGYGFVKFPIEKLLVKGDAFAFDLSYTGSINDATVLIRLIEEDGDRWVFRQKISKLTEKRLVVPYMAFTLSEYKGDGSRQFYYVKQFQFGIEGVYQSGSVTVSDFTVTALEEEIEDLYMTKVADNGVIDDFNSYSTDVELYYKWRLSSSNKDEALATEKSLAFGTDNVCARMGYKADMGQAQYATMIEDSPEGYSALSLWAMDKSVKHDDSAYNYLEEVNAEMVVSLYLAGGEEYRAEKTDVSKYWTEYTFAFDDFTLAEGFFGQVQPLVSENVVAVKICFQYYYYAMISGVKTPKPTYVSGNYVYIDNLKFTTASESGVKELTHKLMPSAENAEICVIDDFDSATEETVGIKGERGYSYEKVELSSETAAGAGKSVRLFYQGNKESVSYAVNTVIDKSVSANSVRLLLKGDGKATVYVNIYMNYAGTTYKYRATLTAVDAEWMVYTIGFDKFEKIEGTGSIALTKSRVQYITKITFGIVNFVDNEVSSIFVDKMTFDGTVPDRQGGTTAFTREEYEGQI